MGSLGQFFTLSVPPVPSLRMGPASTDCWPLCDSQFSFYCLVAEGCHSVSLEYLRG